jgi:hypothetical protein
MRSIRVGGSTLARVVFQSFLERKRKREVKLEIEATFAEMEHASQGI